MATTTPAIISLGSNLGDRRGHLRQAVRRMGRQMRVVRVSSLYETSALETPPGSPPFLNAVALVLTSSAPEELLLQLQRIESDLGRRRTIRNASRTLDLDLILYGSRIVRSPDLTVPHPRYRERNFVLAPLRELRLTWIDPIAGKPVVSFQGRGEVRKLW